MATYFAPMQNYQPPEPKKRFGLQDILELVQQFAAVNTLGKQAAAEEGLLQALLRGPEPSAGSAGTVNALAQFNPAFQPIAATATDPRMYGAGAAQEFLRARENASGGIGGILDAFRPGAPYRGPLTENMVGMLGELSRPPAGPSYGTAPWYMDPKYRKTPEGKAAAKGRTIAGAKTPTRSDFLSELKSRIPESWVTEGVAPPNLPDDWPEHQLDDLLSIYGASVSPERIKRDWDSRAGKVGLPTSKEIELKKKSGAGGDIRNQDMDMERFRAGERASYEKAPTVERRRELLQQVMDRKWEFLQQAITEGRVSPTQDELDTINRAHDYAPELIDEILKTYGL